MKIRKRMGLPRARMAPSRDAAKHTVPDDIVEILRDRARRTVIAEHELAAKQRRLLALLSANVPAPSSRAGPSNADAEDVATTPEKLVALLSRMAGT